MSFKLTIPTELKEIKLKDYQKYMKMVRENEDAINFLDIKAVEVFCGVKINDIRSLDLKDFEDGLDVLRDKLMQTPKFQKRFKIGDVEYGFIPDISKISTGEYIDLETYIPKKEDELAVPDFSEAHKAMAVMYRPITYSKKDMYLIEDYEGSEKYSDIMREAPIDVVLGANVFFYNLGMELLRSTIAYLQEEGKTNIQVNQILEENGVGIRAFMQSLEGNYFDLTMSQN